MQREPHVIRVRNAHTAKVCGVLPRAVGEVDANNPGVRVALSARRLVPVTDDGPEGELPADVVVNPADLLAARDEIKSLRDALAHERDSAAAHIADLERELAEARAQIDTLTAPKAKKGG
jgi:hypothetical protein